MVCRPAILMNAIAILALAGCVTVGETSDLKLDVSPLQDTSGVWHLQIHLEYSGEKPLTIFRDSLPWSIRRNLVLVAIRLDPSRTRLEEIQPIDDPGPGELTLNPGERLSGTVELSHRFPGLNTALRERDVIVFWSYQMKPPGTQPLPRQSGAVAIPRQN